MKYILYTILFLFLSVSTTSAATMSITVAQQSVSKGDTFIVEWYLDSKRKAINVVDATLYYSPETLEVEDVVTGSSALSLWIQQPTVIEKGTLRFVGGIPAGVTGTKIPVVRMMFRATQSGTASIALGKDAKVVLSDGVATTESVTMEPIIFPVLSEKIEAVRSPTHRHQDRWYRANDVTFEILEKNPVVYSLSANPEITPSGDPVVVGEPIVYEDLRDGMYYFKVATSINGGLQELQTYRVLIDHTAPEMSGAEIDTASELFGGKPSLSFYAVDKTSGIAQVKVKTGWFGWYKNATSPYRLHKPLFGNVVKLQVTDKAGNETLSTLYFRGYLANWVSYCVTLILLIWIVLISIRKRKRIRSITKKILRQLLQRSHSSL